MGTAEPVQGPIITAIRLSGESGSTLGPLSNTNFTPSPRAPMYLRSSSFGTWSYSTVRLVRLMRAMRFA